MSARRIAARAVLYPPLFGHVIEQVRGGMDEAVAGEPATDAGADDHEAAAIAIGIEAAARSAPPGLRMRGFRDAADFDAMAVVRNAAAIADGQVFAADGERIAGDFRLMGMDPATSIILAEQDGSVVGWVRIWDAGVDPEVGRVVSHNGCVHPAQRRRGIGGALVAGAQAACRERLRVAPAAGVKAFYRTSAVVGVAGAQALFEREGYRAQRWMYDMIRPTLDDIPDAGLPEGIEWRPVRREDATRVVRAFDEAMHDHPGWRPITDPDEVLTHPLFGQIDVWQVAWDGDEPVGGVLGFISETENEASGRKRGYTEAIFTRRPWRKRGIAAAMIARNLRLLRERGMTEAALSVDTENPSGALALYERMGFVPESEMVILIRRIDSSRTPM